MIAEAHVGDAVSAIHGEGEDPLSAGFAHGADLVNDALILGIEDRQHHGCPEIEKPAVDTHEAIVCLTADAHLFDELAVFGVEDQNPALFPGNPPSGRHVDLRAIHGDRRSITAQLIVLFPGDLVRFQIEGSYSGVLGGEVSAMGRQARGETPKAFLEDGDIDPANELMAVIDIEDQNAGAFSLALRLGRVGCAEVEITLRLGLLVGLPARERGGREKNRGERK